MHSIQTSGLVKKYGNFTAVDNLSMQVEEGIVYGLLGPNGSGKTTTIKMLCGVLKPTSGEAKMLGQPPSKSLLKQVGYMPQDTAVYMDNTVHENIQLYGEIYGLTKDEINKRESQLLDFIDLADWKGALASHLSGGMRHRLSLACALVHEPRILFLDEPTVGVDPELRAAFWEYFTKLASDGVTVFITTHYMDEASHCDIVGLLRRGKLIAEAPPEQLKKDTGTESLEDAFLALARRDEKQAQMEKGGGGL